MKRANSSRHYVGCTYRSPSWSAAFIRWRRRSPPNGRLYDARERTNVRKAMAAKQPPKRSASLSRTKTSRTKSSQRNRANAKSRSKSARKNLNCPIVGVGGSAGGFEATMELLRHLPAKNGMSFVVVQHLDPHHASKLASLLGKVTAMPVIEITKTTRPQPNTVYVQPSNKCVVAKNDKLVLVRRTQQLNVAIDQFFESLAEACGSRGIGVLLSGTGSDGTAGLRAIKVAGGLTFAQDEG